MRPLARLVEGRPLLVLGVVALVSVLAGSQIPRLVQDDDVVRFLPADDPEIRAFKAITDRFGAMEVALIAVEAGGDQGGAAGIYTEPGLDYVRRLTRALARLPEIVHVTSVTELAIVERTDDGGSAHVALVPPEIPEDAASLMAIRERILGRDYLAGLLASADGTGAVLVAQLRTAQADGTTISAKRAAEVVKAAALAVPAPPDVRLHLGGAPFITEAAANGSQADLARLGPFVAGLTLLVVIVALGSLLAALYAVLTVGVAILWTLGLMAVTGHPLTLVSSSLPVILLTLGSAYAVHLLVWYREHGADVRAALADMGPPIGAAALVQIVCFLSFLVMDLAPLREFGWQMAAGSAIAGVLALTFLPALLMVRPIAPRRATGTRLDRWLVAVAARCRRQRWPVLLGAAAIAAGLATQLARVDARMDTSAFFEEGSAPARADRFLADKLGGSMFLQVLVEGDLRDPAVLHRLAAFEDRLAAVPGVTRTQSIADVLAIVHEGLKGERRQSRSRAEIEQLGFLAQKTDPAVALLVDEGWRGALVQVRIGSFDTALVERTTPAVRDLAARHLEGGVATVERASEGAAEASRAVFADAAERIAALAGKPEITAALEAALAAPVPAHVRPEVERAVAEVIKVEIVEEEMVALAAPERAAELGRAVVDEALALRLDRARFEALLERHVAAAELEDRERLGRSAGYLYTQIEVAVAPLVRRDLVLALRKIAGPLGAGAELRVAAIADEVMQPRWYVRAPGATSALTVTVSGQPAVQQAMTRSVQRNQVRSLAVGLPLVLLVLVLVFRSPIAAGLGILPAGFTLLVTFGLMGLFPERLPMDIAAPMLVGIALGVGIDYAVHFLWRYRHADIDKAMLTTGRAILINATEITAGFIVLAWATIAPISRFGLLTAQMLLVAAVATLVLLPASLALWNQAMPKHALAWRASRRSPPVAARPSEP